jgi:hypothetical protein
MIFKKFYRILIKFNKKVKSKIFLTIYKAKK